MPKISILVPIFNVEKYLEQCLDSIVSQTLQDIEVICINDGSTDTSLKIIKKYARKDSRIVILDKKNSGYGDSMNKGLKKATGEYIGIVESDDWVESDAYEKLLKIAEQHDAEVVKCNFYNYHSSVDSYKPQNSLVEIINTQDLDHVVDTSRGHGIMWQQPSIWSAIYKRSFLAQHHIDFLPTPGASYQDTAFSFKVWSSATRVVFTRSAYLHYRQDNENSSINSPGKVFCVSDEYTEIEQYLKKTHRFEDLKDIMYSTRWGGYRWNIERLTPELAKDFILYAAKEYQDAYTNGDFNFAHFDANATREVQELIHATSRFIRRKEARSTAKVSVIVPVYNVQKYLTRCLDSIISQTFSDIEIIAIDDGSTDHSPEILEEYYTNEPRLVIYNSTNGGLSAARNRGIELSSTDYLTFCDSDDYFNPETIANLHKAMVDNEVQIAIGSSYVSYESGGITALDKNIDRQYYTTKYRGSQQITDTVLSKTDISVSNKMFDKRIVDRHAIRFPEGLMYEDAYFTHTYCWMSSTAFFLAPDNYIYNYVRRPGSIMAETNPDAPYRYDHLSIIELLFDFLKQSNLFAVHTQYFAKLYKDYLELTISGSAPEHHEYTYNRTREFLESHKQYIMSIDPDAYKHMVRLLPAKKDSTPRLPIQEPQETQESPTSMKQSARKVLSKISPSYRHIYRAASEVDALSQQVVALQDTQQATLESLETTHEHLEKLTRKLDRLRHELQQ